MSESGIGDVGNGRSRIRDRIGRRHGVKKTLGDKVSHGVDGVGLMVEISGNSRESGQVSLSDTKVGKHVDPGFIDRREAVPDAQVVLKKRQLDKDDVGNIHLLAVGHEGPRVFEKIGEIINCGEHSVDLG